MMRRSALPVLVLVTSAVAACGGASASVTASTPASAKAPATASAPAPAPQAPVAALSDHALHRGALVTALSGGLGLFLQKVTLDDQPVMKGGHFYGFRVTALSDPGFWSGVDIKPGDVVTRVNGMPIEHPEEALEAFHSLGIASELRVAYERDGQLRELRYPIVDDEPQKRADASVP